MGSATTQARAEAVSALEALEPGVERARVGRELFAALGTLESNPALRQAVGDSSSPAQAKTALVSAVFGPHTSADTLALLSGIARARWSDPGDVVGAVEELGIRAYATSAGAASSVDEEILAFAAVVGSDPQLELALSSKLGTPEARVGLIRRLLEGRASEATVEILTQLVRAPRGRRIVALLAQAARIVADAAGFELARVTVARPLSAEQSARLEQTLSERYGRPVRATVVVDPALVGGARVQIGDDVIDGSVSGRIAELRRRLAG